MVVDNVPFEPTVDPSVITIPSTGSISIVIASSIGQNEESPPCPPMVSSGSRLNKRN